jgi:hypothetical protein
MEELLSSNTPDAPTPISSAGNPTQKYGNAAGEFDLKKSLKRKVKSRVNKVGKVNTDLPDVSQPEYGEDDSTKRYFGSFSVETKRNVFDLLKSHPEFGKKGNMRMNRIGNNTREVMPSDPTKTVENGGHIVYQDQPQASQNKY